MFVKNNIARPGEIKSVVLSPYQIEVRLSSGEVLHYERKGERDQVQALPDVHQEVK